MDEESNSQQNQEPSFYREENESPPATGGLPEGQEVSWTASEYIAHHKTMGWYVALGFVTLALAAVIYLLTKDVVTVIAIVVVAFSFGFFASRHPDTLNYQIGPQGITIGSKLYPYALLRTFSIQQEGAINCIVLIPMQRFTPAISLYYPPDQEEQIIQTLSTYLPHEERKPDPIDRLMRKIRF